MTRSDSQNITAGGHAVSAILVISLICIAGDEVYANNFVRTAKSGQPTRMVVYKSWKTDCTDNVGIVKINSKPANGTLTPTQKHTDIDSFTIHAR